MSGGTRQMNKMLATTLFLLVGVSGCTSMGTRVVAVHATNDECSAEYTSGTEIAHGFNGKLTLHRKPFGKCEVAIKGEGGAVDPTEGHKATAEIVKEGVKTVVEGVRRGFVPGR